MILFLILIMLYFSSLSYADSNDKVQGLELTPEQQNELAKEIGVVFKGMKKADVKETFGLLQPKVWHTPEGQEVWYYKSPRKQNIYFNGDIAEKVEYTPPKKKPKGESELEL